MTIPGQFSNELILILISFIAPDNFHIKHQFTLKKHQRLKSRKIIQKLFESGQTFSEFPLRVLYAENVSGPELQAAFSVSSKRFQRSVDRNRIKRLMREAWRLQSPMLRHNLVNGDKKLSVFLMYTGNEMPAYGLIEEKMNKLINRIITVVA